MTLPGKATHQQTRAYNRGLVLRTLYDLGPISRAEVARLTGLTRTTVSELVADAHRRGPGRARSAAGRRPAARRRSSLQLVDDARLVVALDLGERAFAGALVDLRGEVRATRRGARRRPRRRRRARGLVHDLVDELVALAPETSPILGIGVGTPGLVDAATGTIRWAVNLDWQDLPLGPDPPRARRPPGERRQRLAAPRPSPSTCSRGAGAPRTSSRSRSAAASAPASSSSGELFHGDGFGAGEIGHSRRRRRRGVPLRPVRLPRDRRQLPRDRPRRDRGRDEAPTRRSDGASRSTTGTLALDDVAQALDDGRRDGPPASSSRPAAGSASRSPA